MDKNKKKIMNIYKKEIEKVLDDKKELSAIKDVFNINGDGYGWYQNHADIRYKSKENIYQVHLHNNQGMDIYRTFNKEKLTTYLVKNGYDALWDDKICKSIDYNTYYKNNELDKRFQEEMVYTMNKMDPKSTAGTIFEKRKYIQGNSQLKNQLDQLLKEHKRFFKVKDNYFKSLLVENYLYQCSVHGNKEEIKDGFYCGWEPDDFYNYEPNEKEINDFYEKRENEIKDSSKMATFYEKKISEYINDHSKIEILKRFGKNIINKIKGVSTNQENEKLKSKDNMVKKYAETTLNYPHKESNMPNIWEKSAKEILHDDYSNKSEIKDKGSKEIENSKSNDNTIKKNVETALNAPYVEVESKDKGLKKGDSVSFRDADSIFKASEKNAVKKNDNKIEIIGKDEKEANKKKKHKKKKEYELER